MNSALGTPLEWLTLISVSIGIISIFIRIGSSQGKQDEKNLNFSKRLDSQGEKIEKIEADISGIKSDVSFIKGKLL